MRNNEVPMSIPDNVVEGQDLDDALSGVLEYVESILQGHNGPNSGFAALYQRAADMSMSAKFTKDGINILESLHYDDPVKEQLLSLLRYVGKGLETAAGDGTTSAIMVAVTLIQLLRSSRAKHDLPAYSTFVMEYAEFTREFQELLQHEKVLPRSDDTELIKKIAYNQAMTSSHGDVKLSKLVVELVSRLPTRALSHITFRREAVETSEVYRLECDDSDFKAPVTILDSRMCNSELGDKIRYEDATVVVPPHELTSNGTHYGIIKEMINELTAESPPFILMGLTPASNLGSELYSLYNEKRLAGCRIAMMWMPPAEVPLCSSTNLIYALGGVMSLNCEPDVLVLTGVKVEYFIGTVKMYNIVTYDENHINEALSDILSPISKFMFVLDQSIEYYMKAIEHPNHRGIVNSLHNIRNTAEFSSLASIVIGGQVYDSKAAKDVLEDVLHAVKESLLHGCVLGGFKTMLKVLQNIKSPMALVFNVAVSSFVTRLYGEVPIHDPSRSHDLLTGNTGDLSRHSLLNDTVILQSVTSYNELVKRLGDILPKIIYMDRMIVPETLTRTEK